MEVDILAIAHQAARVTALGTALATAGLPTLAELDATYDAECVRMPRNLGAYLERRVSTVRTARSRDDRVTA